MTEDPDLRSVEFQLWAMLSGRRVAARREAGVLQVDPRLLERAKLLVALGEAFSMPGCERTVDAGLDDPLQAALTLVRAADRVIDFRLTLGGFRLSFSA